MGFNLWLAREEEISRYYLRRFRRNRRTGGQIPGQIMLGDEPGVVPLSLTIDGEVKDDFTLDEIDSFLCNFENSDDVRKAFLKYPDYKEIADRVGNLIIASSDDDIGKFKIIYGSPFLKKCADIVRSKRKRKENPLLDDTPEMREFVDRILHYAVDENTKDLLFSFQLLIPPIKDVLRKYRYSISQNDIESSKALFESFLESCLNYKVTRAFVIWEQNYLATKVKEQQKAANSSRAGTNDITQAQAWLRDKEANRFAPVVGDVAYCVDTFMRNPDGAIDLDKVWGTFDVGDFGIGDLQRLGVLPHDYSDKVTREKGKK